jgi:hypothetical protein
MGNLARTDQGVFDSGQFRGENFVSASDKFVKIVHPADGATAESHQLAGYVFFL